MYYVRAKTKKNQVEHTCTYVLRWCNYDDIIYQVRVKYNIVYTSSEDLRFLWIYVDICEFYKISISYSSCLSCFKIFLGIYISSLIITHVSKITTILHHYYTIIAIYSFYGVELALCCVYRGEQRRCQRRLKWIQRTSSLVRITWCYIVNMLILYMYQVNVHTYLSVWLFCGMVNRFECQEIAGWAVLPPERSVNLT